MASTETAICNLALMRMGQSLIDDIDGTTALEEKCTLVFDQVRDELLKEGPEKGWKFALKRATIAVDASSPNDEYDYRYKLPNDFIRMVKVHEDGTELTDWRRNGEYIVTNQQDDEVDFHYVSRVTVTGLFPPHFTRVLALWLAYELCFNIVQSKNHANSVHEELYRVAMPKAIALDEQDKYVQEESSSWVDIGRTVTTFE